jgi:hypothetical protein
MGNLKAGFAIAVMMHTSRTKENRITDFIVPLELDLLLKSLFPTD